MLRGEIGLTFKLGYRETAYTAVLHALQGPLVALGSYLLRPYQVLAALAPIVSIVSLLSFLVIGLYLYGVNSDEGFSPIYYLAPFGRDDFLIWMNKPGCCCNW